jgi:hypothetical protein
LHISIDDPRVFKIIKQIDDDTIARAAVMDCQYCGGRLDKASFQRKPNGIPLEIADEFDRRASFCCREDGCRKRLTPKLLMFLGKKSYASVVIILLSAIHQGFQPGDALKIRQTMGISRKTLGRWLKWWRNYFPTTPSWRVNGGYFVPSLDETLLPRSLLERCFVDFDNGFEWFIKCLKLLS